MTHPLYFNQSMLQSSLPSYPNLINLQQMNPMMNPAYQNQLNFLILAKQEQERQAALMRFKELNLQRQIQQFRMVQQMQNNKVFQCEQPSPFEDLRNYTPTSSPPSTKLRSDSYISEAGTIEVTKNKEALTNVAHLQLKAQISQMINFFVTEFGKVNQERVLQQRNLYAFNQTLLSLFDELTQKYSSSTKCREDMMRFVLRKALSFLRDSLRDKQGLTARAASILLCQKYFKLDSEDLNQKVNTKNEKEVLSFLLPYKKNSRNKTANTKFMTEIFASEAFYQDYLEYLDNFDEILGSDNQKKIGRFSEFLFNCVKENNVEKVRNYKRLPWLKVWEETTKVIAFEMLNAKSGKKIGKGTSEANPIKKIKGDN
jgi:hypothetical protein